MDIVLIHSIYTVFVALVFLGICWWAFDRRSQTRFDAAARIPLEDDDAPGASFPKEKNNA
jgi:cytochrome c oxidase cbb3-type subunit IV